MTWNFAFVQILGASRRGEYTNTNDATETRAIEVATFCSEQQIGGSRTGLKSLVPKLQEQDGTL